MRKILVGLTLALLAATTNASDDWVLIKNEHGLKTEINARVINEYGGRVIGGSSPRNYVSSFIRFTYANNHKDYSRDEASKITEFVSDCSKNMLAPKSIIVKDINGRITDTVTRDAINQSDLDTAYPDSIGENIVFVSCKINDMRRDK